MHSGQRSPLRNYFFRGSRLKQAIAFFWGWLLISLLSLSPSARVAASSPLPNLRVHPLPPTLANWQAPRASGDYFDQIQAVSVGYLVWSAFPITVYIEPIAAADQVSPFLERRSRTWIATVQAAMQDWQPYLPLQQVEQAATADISIFRVAPPLRFEPHSAKSTGDRALPIPRARNAETQFELYAKSDPSAAPGTPAILAQRFTLHIRPDLPTDYLLATARHELGHALGLWGHSPNPTDSMYFSQVRNPAKISMRDLNTLRRVYEQPTRLGWALS